MTTENTIAAMEAVRQETIERVLGIVDERISLLDEEHEGDAVVVVRLALQDLADEIEALRGDEQ